MCLVLSVFLGGLSINFYLDGFLAQASVTGLMALGLLILMAGNIRCGKKGCRIKDEGSEADESGFTDLQVKTPDEKAV